MKRALAILAVLLATLSLSAPLSAQANPDRVNEIRDEARQAAESRREAKDARIAEIRAEAEARKLTMQKERCEAREAKLQALVPKLSNSATRLKGVIDKVYERVTGFYASGQLTVQNYEELVEAIELAKANSESSLEALGSYEFEFDCETAGVGQQLDAYRTAVKETRESLRAYHKSVVDLISSLQSEHSRANRTDDSGDETENEGEENEGTETENETE